MKSVAWIRTRKTVVAVTLICTAMVFAKPLYGWAFPETNRTWVSVFQEAPEMPATRFSRSPAGPTSDELFGRQLDALTSLYNTVITFLSVALAGVVTLAFITIRANHRAETEKAIRDAIESNSMQVYLQSQVAAEVARQVEEQIGDVANTLEELQALYEALDDIVSQRNRGTKNGNHQTAKGPPHP